jgi:hypothetical protein
MDNKQFAISFLSSCDLSYGARIELEDLFHQAGLCSRNAIKNWSFDDIQQRNIAELNIIMTVQQVALERYWRALRRRENGLHVLHPKEQLEYGRKHYLTAAIRKLHKGAQIVKYTDNISVRERNDAYIKLMDIEQMLKRKLDGFR